MKAPINTMFKGVCRLIALVALLGATAAFGQDDPQISIEINKGKLVRLKKPATSVIIADPEIADIQVISPSLVYVNGRAVGETTIFAVDNDDFEILNAVVNVTHNLSKLNKTVKAMLPLADVNFNSVDNALVVNGYVDSPLEADSVSRLATPFLRPEQTLVNMLKTGGSDQVTLMVKVAEVSRSELKRFGIHLENIINTGNFVFGLANGRDVIGAASGLTRSGLDGSIFGGFNSGSGSINTVIDALEDEGLLSILAEPSLTAMSGKPASFLAGGEFPVPTVDDEGSVSVEFRPFGVSLAFSPVVMTKDKISLTVAPEVSTLSELGAIEVSGFNIPSLSTRRAETTVELGSGQTFAIAGLLQNNTSNDVDKFPGLGDIPVLGALFRSSEWRRDQTELVILVTPYIVSAVSDPSRMALPQDGLVAPTDLERILFGKIYHEYNKPTAQGDTDEGGTETASLEELPRLNGPVGFVLK